VEYNKQSFQNPHFLKIAEFNNLHLKVLRVVDQSSHHTSKPSHHTSKPSHHTSKPSHHTSKPSHHTSKLSRHITPQSPQSCRCFVPAESNNLQIFFIFWLQALFQLIICCSGMDMLLWHLYVQRIALFICAASCIVFIYICAASCIVYLRSLYAVMSICAAHCIVYIYIYTSYCKCLYVQRLALSICAACYNVYMYISSLLH